MGIFHVKFTKRLPLPKDSPTHGLKSTKGRQRPVLIATTYWQGVVQVTCIFLFVDQFPEHQGSIGAANGDDILIVVEEPSASHQRAVHFFLDVLSFGAGTWIPEESKISFGIAAHQHIVRC